MYSEDELIEFLIETWGWDEDKVLSHPYARIVELLEARASRISRQQQDEQETPSETERRTLEDGTPIRSVNKVSDFRALGLGSGGKG